jgi:mRNA-degrading endonuclease RelE of RelBE toxin-antitoxin system
MQTIVELPEFKKKSDKLLTDSERESIINYLAAHPASGDIMKGTGGLRKLRWSVQGKGKSGGVRVIYYFHNEFMPLFLLSLFGKGEKAYLTKGERNDLAKLTSLLVKNYGGSK